MSFELALIQMTVAGGHKARNLARAEAMIAQAAAHGSRLVLLPEALDLGWTHPSSATEAEPIPGGEPYRRLAHAASAYGVHVCGGLTERCGDRVFNSAVLIGPHGELLGVHRKINELEIGHSCYATGDRLTVVQTALGVVGVMLCADAFAAGQVLSRSLCYMGADLLVSPCAWAVPGDHDPAVEPYGGLWRSVYQPVARDFSVTIAGASCVGQLTAGPWAGRKCIGCSLVVGPGGHELLQGPYGVDAEAILPVTVEPVKRPARGEGWIRHWQRQAPASIEPHA